MLNSMTSYSLIKRCRSTRIAIDLALTSLLFWKWLDPKGHDYMSTPRETSAWILSRLFIKNSNETWSSLVCWMLYRWNMWITIEELSGKRAPVKEMPFLRMCTFLNSVSHSLSTCKFLKKWKITCPLMATHLHFHKKGTWGIHLCGILTDLFVDKFEK